MEVVLPEGAHLTIGSDCKVKPVGAGTTQTASSSCRSPLVSDASPVAGAANMLGVVK